MAQMTRFLQGAMYLINWQLERSVDDGASGTWPVLTAEDALKRDWSMVGAYMHEGFACALGELDPADRAADRKSVV